MKKTLFFGILLSLVFSLGHFAKADAANNFVETNAVTNIDGRRATLNGKTDMALVATTDVVVTYFEYGPDYSNLTLKTPEVSLSAGTLDTTGNYRKFTANVTDLTAGRYNYYRFVRKVTPQGGTEAFYKGQVLNHEVDVENLSPKIATFLSMSSSFATSNCDEDGCTIEIPENLPSFTKIAQMETFDPNGDLMSINITSGNTNGAFELTPYGSFSVARKEALDYETKSQFDIVIEVKDYGRPRLASTYDLKVRLVNITDESTPLPPSYVPSTSAASSYSYVYNPTSGSSPNYTIDTGRSTSYTYTYRPNINYTIDTTAARPYTYNPNSTVPYQGTGSSNINNNTYTPVTGASQSWQNNPQLAALVQSILLQIQALQRELDDRVRRGLP